MEIIKIALITSLSTLMFAQSIDNNKTINIENNSTTTSFSYTQLITKDIEIGKKYLDENKINLAIASFERVLIYDSQNNTAKFYLGKIFEKQNNIKLAKKYLNSIKHPTQQMQKEIEEFMKKYPDKNLKFNIYLKVGANFDTNIDNNTDEDKWNIIQNNKTKTIYNTSNKKLGFSVYGLVSLSPVYSLKENQITNTFTIYARNVLDYADKNIAVFSYKPSFTNHIDKFILNHAFDYQYIRYANTSYLNRFEISEKVKFNFLNDHTNISKFAIFFNKYIQTHDNDYYGISLDTKVIKHLLSNLDIAINVGIEDTTKTKQTNNKLLEYTSYQSGLATDFNIFSKDIKLSVDYNLKRYKKENSYFQKTQIDKKLEYGLIVASKSFFTYQTEIKYINNISNIKPYSYNKWIVGFNIIKTFKGL